MNLAEGYKKYPFKSRLAAILSILATVSPGRLDKLVTDEP